MDDIKQAIAAYNPDNSRSQLMQRGSNKIILDAYNANPASMNAAISNFASLELPGKTLWIGDLMKYGVQVTGKAEDEPNMLVSALYYLGPTLLIIGFWFFMMRTFFSPTNLYPMRSTLPVSGFMIATLAVCIGRSRFTRSPDRP